MTPRLPRSSQAFQMPSWSRLHPSAPRSGFSMSPDNRGVTEPSPRRSGAAMDEPAGESYVSISEETQWDIGQLQEDQDMERYYPALPTTTGPWQNPQVPSFATAAFRYDDPTTGYETTGYETTGSAYGVSHAWGYNGGCSFGSTSVATAFDNSHQIGTQHYQDYSTGSVRTPEEYSPVAGQFYNGIDGNSTTTQQSSSTIPASISPPFDASYFPEPIVATTNIPFSSMSTYVTEAWDSNEMIAAYDSPSFAPEALQQSASTNQGYDDTPNYGTTYRADPLTKIRFDNHHETTLPRQGSLSAESSPGVSGSDDPQEHDPKLAQSAEETYPCSVCNRFRGDVRSLRDHMRCHDKRHGCSRCPKRFSTPRDLLRHEKAVHENAFTKCPQCSALLKGNREDNLQRHMKACHPEVAGGFENYAY